MNDFEKAMVELASVEHNSDSTKVLHKNVTENGLTFFGIYQSANPNLKIWGIIERYLDIEPDVKKCGAILLGNVDIMKEVNKFYFDTYWVNMNLDSFNHYHKKLELFIFAVNVWIVKAVKELQKMLGFTGGDIDGNVGSMTIARVNAYEVNKFSRDFDLQEIAYYEKIGTGGNLRYVKGWKARAVKY